MTLTITSYVLGPLENNTYVLADSASFEAVIIDPALGSEAILEDIQRSRLKITAICITHAHFDHISGINQLVKAIHPLEAIGLHPDDLDLWREGGGARYFGINLRPEVEPTLFFFHGQQLNLGKYFIEVRHTPGHSRGHVVFYAKDLATVFCGDLIFHHSIGRTDLPGGELATLLNSIRSQILTLPPQTRLLSGHGPETSVGEEKTENPFLR
ncbi:MAG: MBL fold metallo-hydrolase [Anaerolineaceae bacterium]|jgi:glyoxylase-like metal-dependent hydrolase (beta-lactamase superfamily II)